MTQNMINYAKLKEDERHNRVQEMHTAKDVASNEAYRLAEAAAKARDAETKAGELALKREQYQMYLGQQAGKQALGFLGTIFDMINPVSKVKRAAGMLHDISSGISDVTKVIGGPLSYGQA